MPANAREIRAQDSASRIGDPSNYPGLTKPGGGRSSDNTENTVVAIFQNALAAAMTAAAIRSGRAR